ncbi:hypothetical protein TNCV_926731, partial [Trichonephila clavipes]
KLKLDGTRATARQRLFPEGWEEMKNRMKENVSNQENSPAERGGGRTPKHETLYRCRAPAGRGRTQGRQSGRLNALDTLRENCGIIRKQASTDGGVLWKVMCVDVVQVTLLKTTFNCLLWAISNVMGPQFLVRDVFLYQSVLFSSSRKTRVSRFQNAPRVVCRRTFWLVKELGLHYPVRSITMGAMRLPFRPTKSQSRRLSH